MSLFSREELDRIEQIDQLSVELGVDLLAVLGYQLAVRAIAEDEPGFDAENFFEEAQDNFIDDFGDIIQYGRAIFNQLSTEG